MDTSDFLELAHDLAEANKSSRLAVARNIRAGLPPMLGADGGNPSHPLGPPVVSGNTVTVDSMLKQPTRVTRMIMDLSLQKFIADRVFSSAGGVQGGAVIYDQATQNELYTDRDVQRVAPAAEFPLVTAPRLVPKLAEVEKWGGKVFITDEAKDRNDSASFTNKVRQLTNTIIRKINQRSVEVLTAAITEHSQTVTGVSWSRVVVGGSSQSNADLFPARDFALVDQLATEDELGVKYTLWILAPQEYTELIIIYGAQGLTELLNALGISVYVSNRITRGTALVVAEGQVGEMRVEKPLSSETWRDADGRERTWLQSSVRPVMYVTNPFAVIEVTGLAA